MKYAQLNQDGSFDKDLAEGNIVFDANNFCTAEALVRDGKDAEFRVVALLETAPPAINPITEAVSRDGAEFVNGQWQYKWRVDALTAEQIAANEVAAAQSMQKAIAAKEDALWAAADRYTSGYISGVAIGILTIGVLQQKPKALAVSAWSSAVWTEYYVRKAQVTVSSVDNHDFTSFGPIPHTVPELQAEVGL